LRIDLDGALDFNPILSLHYTSFRGFLCILLSGIRYLPQLHRHQVLLYPSLLLWQVQYNFHNHTCRSSPEEELKRCLQLSSPDCLDIDSQNHVPEHDCIQTWSCPRLILYFVFSHQISFQKCISIFRFTKIYWNQMIG